MFNPTHVWQRSSHGYSVRNILVSVNMVNSSTHFLPRYLVHIYSMMYFISSKQEEIALRHVSHDWKNKPILHNTSIADRHRCMPWTLLTLNANGQDKMIEVLSLCLPRANAGASPSFSLAQYPALVFVVIWEVKQQTKDVLSTSRSL